jgi:lysyl-tRNA synthetase, class II
MAEERLEEIRQARLQKRQALIDAGQIPYPAEVRRTHTVAQVLKNFNQLQEDTSPIVVVGRVTALREHGAVAFVDVTDATDTIQLQVNRAEVDQAIFARLNQLDVGDWIQATGQASITKRGTQAVSVSTWHMISKSIRPLPATWYGLKDHETRWRQREIDLLFNKQVKHIFRKRTQVIDWLRGYLTAQGFHEVETPVLQPIPGGASAKPFVTHHHALDIDLYLRVAPELYLKRLLVGGYEKVFEIGRNFRNEGISREHNPEFTMLEFYWAYADYEDLMDVTETLLDQLVRELNDTSEVSWQDQALSFEKPFARKPFVEVVSRRVGFDILQEKDPQAYLAVLEQEDITIPSARTYAKLVEEIYKELIRPTLIQPIMLYDYPVEMVPLAKQNLTDPRIAEKFQLVIGGTEIANAYTELNDPVEQRQRFIQQQADRQAGDQEAHVIDEDYLRALEYGMPPAGGYGLGVDRLVMLLTNRTNIRDTILFPLLKPEQ